MSEKMSETSEAPLTTEEIAVLAMLRDIGPRRLSMMNEEAIDSCFKRKPKLVSIHTSHPTDPLIDITTQGLRLLAAATREEKTS